MADRLSDVPDNFRDGSRMVKLSLPRFGPMIRSKGTFNMRHFSWKRACTVAVSTGILASCGGSASMPPLTEAICEQPWSWAKGSGLGAQSFSAESIAQKAEVIWSLQNCKIQKLNSLQLTVCIRHNEPSELNLKLYRGSESTPLALPKLDQTSQSGTCEQGSQGTPWTYTIANPTFNTNNTSQQWRLVIEDEQNNQNTGFFDGWSFTLKGFN